MHLMLQFQRSKGSVHVYEVQMVVCSEWIIGQVTLTVVLSKWNASHHLHQSTSAFPHLVCLHLPGLHRTSPTEIPSLLRTISTEVLREAWPTGCPDYSACDQRLLWRTVLYLRLLRWRLRQVPDRFVRWLDVPCRCCQRHLRGDDVGDGLALFLVR